MAQKTTRKMLLDHVVAAQLALDRLDQHIFGMVQTADQRSEPITEMAPVLADGHEVLRKLWASLRDRL